MVPRPKLPSPVTISASPKDQVEMQALATILDPKLLRGVSLGTCLSGAAKHWSSEGSGRSQVEKEEKDYGLSRQVTQLDHFLSHDWATSRWQKYLSLLLIFNLTPASIACFVVSLIMAVIVCLIGFIGGKPWVLKNWTPVYGYVTFVGTLLYWQVVKEIAWKPTLVFLDKLCIAQHDPALKEKGILGLASFLLNSKTLTILWSPRYFTRLWCAYEIATYFKDDQEKRLELMPVALSTQIFLVGVIAHSYTWCLKMLVLALWDHFDHLDTILIVLCVLVPVFSVVTGFLVYVGIGLLEDVEALPQQLSNFKVKDSKCFCCSVDHTIPETGEEIPCDRQMVFHTLKTWYGTEEGEENHLDAFDCLVQRRLKSLVVKQLGENDIPSRYIVPIILSATFPFLPVYLPEWVEGHPTYTHWDHFTFQIRELVEFFHIALMSFLVSLLASRVSRWASAMRRYRNLSRWQASMVSGPLLVLLVVIVEMPVEVVFLLTEKNSLLPVIPFTVMLLIVLCLRSPPRCYRPNVG